MKSLTGIVIASLIFLTGSLYSINKNTPIKSYFQLALSGENASKEILATYSELEQNIISSIDDTNLSSDELIKTINDLIPKYDESIEEAGLLSESMDTTFDCDARSILIFSIYNHFREDNSLVLVEARYHMLILNSNQL